LHNHLFTIACNGFFFLKKYKMFFNTTAQTHALSAALRAAESVAADLNVELTELTTTKTTMAGNAAEVVTSQTTAEIAELRANCDALKTTAAAARGERDDAAAMATDADARAGKCCFFFSSCLVSLFCLFRFVFLVLSCGERDDAAAMAIDADARGGSCR
jgi:hypothetical protein